MHRFIQDLPFKIEFLIVVFGAFGIFVAGSVLAAISPTHLTISDASLQVGLAYEVILLAILAPFLHFRGWTFQRIGLRPNTLDTVLGLAFATGLAFLLFALWWLLLAVSDQSRALAWLQGLHENNLSLPTIAAFSIVNPAFEEIFLCGYIVTALREQNRLATAINISLVIRLACHLYQGPGGLVTILPFGLICTFWYARTGRLWPVIVLHAAFDFFPLLAHSA